MPDCKERGGREGERVRESRERERERTERQGHRPPPLRSATATRTRAHATYCRAESVLWQRHSCLPLHRFDRDSRIDSALPCPRDGLVDVAVRLLPVRLRRRDALPVHRLGVHRERDGCAREKAKRGDREVQRAAMGRGGGVGRSVRERAADWGHIVGGVIRPRAGDATRNQQRSTANHATHARTISLLGPINLLAHAERHTANSYSSTCSRDR